MVARLSVAAFVAAVGCSWTTAPQARPTILVTNAICAVGPCRTLAITASISSWDVPQPLGGLEILGYVHGPAACLQFPAKWTLEVGPQGGPFQQLTWTPTNPSGLVLWAWDSALTATNAQYDSISAGLWPYIGPAGSEGSTPNFVPGTAPGWSVTFPSKSPSGTAEPSLVSTAACPSPEQPPPQ